MTPSMQHLRHLLIAATMMYALSMPREHTLKRRLVLRDDSVTAIDVLLEPDATMLEHAEAVNPRLLKVFPNGFPLDSSTART